MAGKEEERKKEYEQKNKAYRGSSEGSNVSHPNLAGSPEIGDDNDSQDENNSRSEEERKARNEKAKKEAREQENKKEEKKEKMKEKGAETVGAFVGLPPVLSRFIYHHKLLSFFLFIVVPFLVIYVTVFVVVAMLHPKNWPTLFQAFAWKGWRKLIQIVFF